MSAGARNCPFFTFTARPVAPAARSRSVWRERKAGICRTSTTSAAGAHWAASCTSVRTGRPVSCFTLASTRSPCVRPGPRKLLPLVRFALSKEHLKTAGNPCRCATSATFRAAARVCASPSITHGPAMSSSGCPGPTSARPTFMLAPWARRPGTGSPAWAAVGAPPHGAALGHPRLLVGHQAAPRVRRGLVNLVRFPSIDPQQVARELDGSLLQAQADAEDRPPLLARVPDRRDLALRAP